MSRALRLLGPLAVLQMAAPGPASAAYIMVASCGGSGSMVPVRVPGKDDGSQNLPCCKVCHISMRKRLTADSCCGNSDEGEDDTDGG